MTAYKVGNQEFTNKQNAYKAIDEIKRKKPYKRSLTKVEKEIMFEVVKTHPDYEDWNAIGIVGIVRVLTKDNWQAFAVVLKDKSEKLFSVDKLFCSKDSKHLKRVRANDAFRAAIQQQIDEFKTSRRLQNGKWESDLSGKLLHICEVDHAVSMWKLITDFMQLHELTLDNLPLERGKTKYSEDGWVLSEPIKSLWIEYHQQNAVLRILSQEENSADFNQHAVNANKYRSRKKCL